MIIPRYLAESYALWAQIITACATSTYTAWVIGTAIRKKYFPPCPVHVSVRAWPMGDSKTICRCELLVSNPSGAAVVIPRVSAIGDYEVGLLEEQKLDDGRFAHWHKVLPTVFRVGFDKEFVRKDAFILKKAEHVSWFHAKLYIKMWVTVSKERTYKMHVVPYFQNINV